MPDEKKQDAAAQSEDLEAENFEVEDHSDSNEELLGGSSSCSSCSSSSSS